MTQDPTLRRLEISNVTRRRALGMYEIFGGIIGLSFGAIMLTYAESGDVKIIMVVFMMLYVFSVTCGVLLLMNRERALPLSLVNQALQIFAAHFGSIGWMYISGLHFSLGIDIEEPGFFQFNMGISGFHFVIGGDPVFKRFMINVVAALLVLYIVQLRRNMRKEVLLKSTEQIGEPTIS